MTVLLLLLAACVTPERECAASGTALATSWRARWRAERCDPEVRDALQRRLDGIDAKMSVWVAGSEINAIRRSMGPVPVSEETWSTVRVALDVASVSGGAFDPTIEPVLRAWGFHGEDRALDRPTPADLERAMARVGWERVKLGRDARGPWVDAADTALDLSAVLEGHALERMSAELSRRGLANHLVDIGGELRVAGEGPDGAWRLGLDVKPGTPGSELQVRLTNAALATSGIGRNPVELDGETVHPKIDPTTGEPSASDVVTVAVVAPDARTADGLATAAALLGSEAGLALLESQPDVEGVIYTDATPRFTTGMRALLGEPR